MLRTNEEYTQPSKWRWYQPHLVGKIQSQLCQVVLQEQETIYSVGAVVCICDFDMCPFVTKLGPPITRTYNARTLPKAFPFQSNSVLLASLYTNRASASPVLNF